MEKYEERRSAVQKESSANKEDLIKAIERLEKVEKSFEEVEQDREEVKSWMFLKNIDLIKALDAIVYRAKIDNRLCDVKKIISNVKDGFDLLVCTQPGCSKKAIMCHKQSNDIPVELYCKKHSKTVDPLNEGLCYFDAELKNK